MSEHPIFLRSYVEDGVSAHDLEGTPITLPKQRARLMHWCYLRDDGSIGLMPPDVETECQMQFEKNKRRKREARQL